MPPTELLVVPPTVLQEVLPTDLLVVPQTVLLGLSPTDFQGAPQTVRQYFTSKNDEDEDVVLQKLISEDEEMIGVNVVSKITCGLTATMAYAAKAA